MLHDNAVASATRQASGKEKEKAEQELTEALNKIYCDMTKASKGATKIYQNAQTLKSLSERQKQAYESMGDALMDVETTVSDLGSLLKFRKTKNGSPLSVGIAKEMQHTAVRCLQALLEDSKTIKALFPKCSE